MNTENRQRQIATILSGERCLSLDAKGRLSCASRTMHNVFRPNIAQRRGQQYFSYSGLFNTNTSNAIIRRLHTALRGGGRPNVRALLNQLNGEIVTNGEGGELTKKRILSIELNSGISELSRRMHMLTYRGQNVQPLVKSRLIRSFISRFGDLTPTNVKLIVPNVSNNNLNVYRKLRRFIKGNFRSSRRLRGLPAIRPGLAPRNESRIRKVRRRRGIFKT